MNEFNLRNKIGIFLIISQFTLVIIVFLFYLIGGYTFDEMTTTIALMFPMLSVYTTGIVKFFIHYRNKTSIEQSQITRQFTFIAWFFPILFVLALGFIIIIKPFQGFRNFGEFKTFLSIIESLFGGFTGYVMSALLEN